MEMIPEKQALNKHQEEKSSITREAQKHKRHNRTWMKELLHHPGLRKATSISSDIMTVLTTLQSVSKNPLAIPGSAMSLLAVAQKHVPAPRSFTDQWLLDNGFDMSLTTVLGAVLKASGLYDRLTRVAIRHPDKASEENYLEVASFPSGDLCFVVKHNKEAVWQTVHFRSGTAYDQIVSEMIRELIPNGSVEVTIDRANMSGGENPNNNLKFKIIGLTPVDYIGTKDVVKFADECEIYRQAGISDGVIIHGPAGSGKTSFLQSYVELTRRKMLMLGAAAINAMIAGDTELIVEAMRPDVLLLDDFEYISDNSSFFTSLPDLRARYPKMLVAITCNNLHKIAAAITRPGRGGRILPAFEAPDAHERLEVLTFYMKKGLSEEDLKWFNLKKLSDAMCEDFTQDWIRSIAGRAVIHIKTRHLKRVPLWSEAHHPHNKLMLDIEQANDSLENRKMLVVPLQRP